MLKASEMKLAIYARFCDLDPDAVGEASARLAEADGYRGSVQRYREGKKILEKFTLKFVAPSAVYAMSDGTIPGQERGKAGYLRVRHGYVGAAEGWHTAIFNPRQKLSLIRVRFDNAA